MNSHADAAQALVDFVPTKEFFIGRDRPGVCRTGWLVIEVPEGVGARFVGYQAAAGGELVWRVT